MTEYVYLIGPRDGLYKIGTSFRPNDRANQLGCTGLVVHVIESDIALKLERVLHLAFHHKRVKFEWFDLAEKDIRIIESLTMIGDESEIPKFILDMADSGKALKSNQSAEELPIGIKGRPKVQEKKIHLAFRAPPDIVERLVRLADRNRRTVSVETLIAVEKHIEDSK